MVRFLAVFSAHAEVVPDKITDEGPGTGILRARGGSSAIAAGINWLKEYSPRTRR